MATTKLSRTIGTPTSGTKFTISAWVKGSMAEGRILTSINGNSSQTWVELQNSGAFRIANYVGSYNMQLITTRLFRDPSAWYNFVIAFDTTQVTDTNRVKLYVNGVQETSFSTTTYPSQNLVLKYGVSGQTFNVGAKDTDTYWNGLMSHVHFIDGLQYAASDFGSVDSTSGIWTINTSPSVTYGNNGFFILKDGNSVTDQSGKGNNFTVASGTLTKTEDCPDNNFCTINPLDNYWQGSTFANGNNTVTTGSNSTTYNTTSFMMATGKFYAECKVISGAAGNQIGVGSNLTASVSASLGTGGEGFVYKENGYYETGGSAVSFGDAYVNGDIIGVALDVTSATPQLYFSKNGVFQGSGNPSAGTGGKSITAVASTTIGAYFFGFCDTATDNTRVHGWNFGNGYFATTAVTTNSGNGYAGAEGKSIFNYQPPNLYSALSTKGLNL